MKRYPITFTCNQVLVILLATALLLVGPTRGAATETETATAYSPEDCIDCHQTDSGDSSLDVSLAAYEASVHGEAGLTCLDCHTGVVDDAHQETASAGAVDCSACHEQENRHGEYGSEDARPQCHDCHTRHEIRSPTDPLSSVHADRLPATCGGCHPASSGDNSYFAWFPAFQIASHNKGDFGNAYEKENCLGCHQGAGAHGGPEPINDQNCHQCHLEPQADGAMWGYIHPAADRDKQPAVFAAASVYQVFVVIGLIVVLGKILDIVFDRTPGKRR